MGKEWDTKVSNFQLKIGRAGTGDWNGGKWTMCWQMDGPCDPRRNETKAQLQERFRERDRR